jgi:hypothetical protein
MKNRTPVKVEDTKMCWKLLKNGEGVGGKGIERILGGVKWTNLSPQAGIH